VIGAYIHRATLARGSVGSGDYGHRSTDWTTPAETVTVSCRYTTLTVAEWERLGFAGEVIYDVMLVVPHPEMPAALQAAGAETDWRVTAVTTADGASLVSAAVDINEVSPILGPGGRPVAWRILGRFVA